MLGKIIAKPLSGFNGLSISSIPNDIIAGMIIAALSIPIAMGYSEISGLPAVYGLYASVIAPLIFALITGTKHIVFGLDSATAAMTGSMIAVMGVASGGDDALIIVPLLAFLTGVFLVIFSIAGAGKLIKLVPMPVMHGFIAGISLTVILGQIPLLIGTSADMSGGVFSDVSNVFASLSSANIPSVILSIVCLAALFLFKKFAPRIPSALIVLISSVIIAQMFSLSDYGLVMLEPVSAGFPLPHLPSVDGVDFLMVIITSFAIALVVALESLLCLETFSLQQGTKADPGSELTAFGISNAVVALFGCPPCSASVSRTASGIASGGKTQLSSVVAALIVLIVAVFCGPFLGYLPRAALSSIVVYALINVVDFSKVEQYARNMHSEFIIFLSSALIVFALGAIIGILVGIVFSIIYMVYRSKHEDRELIGSVAYRTNELPKAKDIDTGFKTEIVVFPKVVSFVNIEKISGEIDEHVENGVEALVLQISKVEILDTTATDKLTQLIDMLVKRGIHVKIVRKMRPAQDKYTRNELKNLMRSAKFYPNVPVALLSLKEAHDEGREAGTPDDWLIEENDASGCGIISGDHPILTLTEQPDDLSDGDVVSGKISFVQSHITVLFSVICSDRKKHPIAASVFRNAENREVIGTYVDGHWKWHNEEDGEDLKAAIIQIKSYILDNVK